MNQRRYIGLLGIACLAICLVGCAGQPPVQRDVSISKAELLDGAAFGVSTTLQLPPAELTAINDDMRAFLKENVPDHLGDRRKVELILAAVIQEGLHLSYNNFKTYTAQEAFYSREGNCMSFTNLFIAHIA